MFSKIQLGFTVALLAVIGVMAFVLHSRTDDLQVAVAHNATLQAGLTTAVEANKANLATLERLTASVQRANAVAEQNAKDAQSAQSALDALQLEVSNVPDPVVPCSLPATQLVLDRLRPQGTPGGDDGRGRAPAGSGKFMDLPRRSDGPGKGH